MLDGNGASGPTQTGFLNFDRFFNANAGVAGREAKRVNEAAANQAQKAKQGVQGVNQSYIDALDGAGKGVVTPGFDAKGNWQGGAAGPSRTPVNPNGTVDVAPAAPGAPAPGQAAAGPSQRDFMAGQRDAAYNAAQAVPDFTDTEGYKAAGDDVREAQRQLDALGSEAGLAELSGGNWADAALLNAAGRQAFQETRDAYGRKGTGHDSITDYANAVAADSVRRGQMKADELRGYGNQYSDALDAFDARQAEAAAAANKPAAPSTGKTFAEMTQDATRTMTWDQVGQRGATNNARKAANWKPVQDAINGEPVRGVGGPGQDAWVLADQMLGDSGIPEELRSGLWDEFRDSLPEGMRNYVNGMVAWDGDMGEQHALANTPEDWQWFQELFRAWLASRPGAAASEPYDSSGDSDAEKAARAQAAAKKGGR